MNIVANRGNNILQRSIRSFPFESAVFLQKFW